MRPREGLLCETLKNTEYTGELTKPGACLSWWWLKLHCILEVFAKGGNPAVMCNDAYPFSQRLNQASEF